MRILQYFILFSLMTFGSSIEAATLVTAFDFETTASLSNPAFAGNTANYVTTTSAAFDAAATGHGLKALTFTDKQEPYESFTYDLPAGLKTGYVALYFKEDFATSSTDPTWGLSFLLEDAANPRDWGALEVGNFAMPPYVPAAYFATEGAVDRLKANDKYDSTILRSANVWHHLVFDIRTTSTLISVDGNVATDVGAPGSEVSAGIARTLRLRVLGNTPSLGGRKNYLTAANATTTTLGYPAASSRVFFDDIVAHATTPAVAETSFTFETVNGVPDYDVPSVNYSAINDNPQVNGFLNKFQITDVAASIHSGTGAAYFAPGGHRLRKLALDLAALNATSGTITLYFYDKLGNDTGQNHTGGSIVLQDGLNPGKWIALEIYNFAFPVSNDPTPGAYNYFFTFSTGAANTDSSHGSNYGSTFLSRYFGNRSIGWHKVEIKIGPTQSRLMVDGLDNSRLTDGIKYGPGLNNRPKLIFLGDTASGGGLGQNFVDLGELYTLYSDSISNPSQPPYTLFDDITIPVTEAPNAARNWDLFQ